MFRKVVFAVVAVATSMAAAPVTQVHAANGLEGVPAFGNVFVIIGENTELIEINRTVHALPRERADTAVGLSDQVLRRLALLHGGLRRHDVRPVHAVRAVRQEAGGMSPGRR